MIELTFASKRVVTPPPVLEVSKLPWYPAIPPNVQQLADAKGIPVPEYLRRDKIVQELYATVKLKAGDTAFPTPPSGYAKYGAVIVIGVCKTYKDFGTDGHWNDDNPMIITFSPSKCTHELSTTTHTNDWYALGFASLHCIPFPHITLRWEGRGLIESVWRFIIE